MLINKLIIASSSYDEAITKCIFNNKSSFDFKIEIITLNQLLDEYQINDEINDENTLIRWCDPKGNIHSNVESVILNRVTYIADSLFLKFIKQDRLYARSEFEAYLGFALNSFQGVGNKLHNGICVKPHSLPEQWGKMKDIYALDTPKFYWGPKEFNKANPEAQVIDSEIHDLLNWRKSQNSNRSGHIFYFEKPIGSPIFLLNIGEKVLFDGNALFINEQVRERLIEILAIVRSKFNYFIFEILFFVSATNITFGCINPNIVKCDKNKNFEKFVCENLIKEFLKCLA